MSTDKYAGCTKVVGQELPAEFANTLRAMRRDRDPRLTATLWLARQWGWTLTVLGDALGVTREAIRQRIDVKPFEQYPTSALPPIPPPPRHITPMPAPPRRRLLVNDELAQRLRDMHAVARTVTGGTPVDAEKRRIGEQLTADLAALAEQGVSIAQLAEVLGVTHLAIRARLARHGFREPSPSQAGQEYRNVQVDVARQRSHCGRSHPMSGDNLGIRPNGTRYCKACNRAHARDRYRRMNSPGRTAVSASATG